MNISTSCCDATWTGMAAAHCTVCHNTFSTNGNADRAHRTERVTGRVICLSPEAVGLVLNKRGLWAMPAPDAPIDYAQEGTVKKIVLAATAVLALTLAGCTSDADVASKNLSKAAEQFEIERQVVFFNGITDKYLLTIEGRCSVEDKDDQLEVTCKVGKNEYKKHFLGLSDNVSYFVEQTEPAKADVYHYRVIFKPETIVPNFDRP